MRIFSKIQAHCCPLRMQQAPIASPDAWWQRHTRTRVDRRDLDLEWREYAQMRIESRESVRKRRRSGDGPAEWRVCSQRQDDPGAFEIHPSPHFSTSVNISSRALQPSAMDLPSARNALKEQLASLLSRLCTLIVAGCGGCGCCQICTTTLGCKRCDQCNACYEAEALRSRHRQSSMVGLCERIAAARPAPFEGPQQLALLLPVLQACDDWELAWATGKAAATVEQQMKALWERSLILIGCLDPQAIVAALPTALQEVAATTTALMRNCVG